jgi:hypothetical protein
MIEVSKQDLSLQDADLLPTREALQANAAAVLAINAAVAHAHGAGAALARAVQTVVVVQK